MQKNAAIIYSYIFLVFFKDMPLNTIYVFGIGKWAKLYRKHAINSKMFMIYSLFPPKCFLIHCKIKIIWQASARFRTDVHNVILSLKCLCSILRFFLLSVVIIFLVHNSRDNEIGFRFFGCWWMAAFLCLFCF